MRLAKEEVSVGRFSTDDVSRREANSWRLGTVTYRDDKVSAGNILSTESDLDDVVAGIVWRVEEIERSIFVVDDVDIEIVAEGRTDAASDGTLASIVRVNIDRVLFADVYIRIDASA